MPTKHVIQSPVNQNIAGKRHLLLLDNIQRIQFPPEAYEPKHLCDSAFEPVSVTVKPAQIDTGLAHDENWCDVDAWHPS